MITAGATDSVVDVTGVRVGQVSRVGDGWRTGVTVLLPPDEGAVAGVDVRGAAPGTRETDLLDPRNMVERVHAICLTGGSAFGLDAAGGVMATLADRGVGLPVGGPGEVVPIVPAAVLFDLGRGGRFRATPDPAMGAAACAAATSDVPDQGSVGAGTGATIGGLAGGIGSASAVLPGGHVVAALVAANAAGSGVDPRTGLPWGARHGLDGEFDDLVAPTSAQLAAWERPAWPVPSLNTTIGVLVTDWGLTKAQCQRVAGAGQDGLARAVHPAHTMVDGDTVFALALGDEAPDLAHYQLLLAAAADVFSRAIVHAMLAATGREGAPGYRELFTAAHR